MSGSTRTRLRFNQVFFALMTLSVVTALAMPGRAGDAGHIQFDYLLIPISHPSYFLANLIRSHFVRQPSEDSRPQQTIEQENVRLRHQILFMQAEMERLQQLAGERQSLGNLESLCQRFTVVGTDTNEREGLNINASLGRVQVNQPVLSGGNLVGRIDRSGPLGAHVHLITDAGFTVTGHFVSFSRAPGQQEDKNLIAIVRGGGRGQMTITNLAMTEVQNVQPGDWIVLSDDLWPPAVQGIRIGQIRSIRPWPQQSQFAEIRLIPQTNLMHLNDLWVMTRQP